MNITIPDQTTVPLGRNSIYGTLDVDLSKFPPHIHDYAYMYGLRQVLNDAMAQKKDEDGADLTHDVIRAKAEKRLHNMYRGELRQRGEAAEPADPVEAEAHKLAKEHLTEVFKSSGHWKDATGKGAGRLLSVINASRVAKKAVPFDNLSSALDQFLAHESNTKFRKTAERNVKERQANVKSVDLDSMGL